MTSKTAQQEQIEKAFLEELQALLDKYKVDIEVEESSSYAGIMVEGISFDFDAIYGDESNDWQTIRPYWSLLAWKYIPHNKNISKP